MSVKFASGSENGDKSDGGKWLTVDDSGSNITVAAASALSPKGKYGMRITITGSAWYAFRETRYEISGTYTGDINAVLRIKIGTAVSAQTQILALWDNAGGYGPGSIRLNAARTLELWQEGISPAQLGIASAALTLNGIYDIYLFYDYSAATVTGYFAAVDANGVAAAKTQFATGAIDIAQDNPDVVDEGLTGLPNLVTGDVHFDDLILTDNGFIEHTDLVHGRPIADGETLEWTRSGGGTSNYYQDIDEVPLNDITDYLIGAAKANYVFLVTAESPLVLGFSANAEIPYALVEGRHRAASASTPAPDWNWLYASIGGGTRHTGPNLDHNDITWKTDGDNIPRNKWLQVTTDPQTGKALTPTNTLTNRIGAIVTDISPNVWVTAMWALWIVRERKIRDPITTNGVVPFPR